MKQHLYSPFAVATSAALACALLGCFVAPIWFVPSIFCAMAMYLAMTKDPIQPTVADAAFTPSRQRWQAVVVTHADKRGRPTERLTILAESSAHLESELLAYFGAIESAGLYVFRKRTLLGFSFGSVAELTQPLLVDPAALYLAEAEVWRQKHERVRP